MTMAQKLIDLAVAEKMRKPANDDTPPMRRDFGTVLLDDVTLDPEPEALISGLLTAGGMSALWGEPGCGKSFLAASMALAVATGSEFFGRRVLQGGVIYVAAEGGRGFKKRLVAHRKRHGIAKRTPFALIPGAVDLCTEGHETEALIAEIRAVAEAIEVPVQLIVIDTLARVMAGGNENDSQDMGALIRNGDRIREATGAHLMFVHHGGKDKDRKTRGHSSFYGALDTAIEVTAHDGSDLKTATVRKQKDGEDGGHLAFRLDVVTVDYRDGEEVTSCVVVPAEEGAAAPQADRGRKLTGVNAIALDALRKAIGDHGTAPPGCEQIPPGTSAVSPDLWRRYFYSLRATETADANRMAFKRAVTELQNRNLVGCWGEYSWPIS